MNDRRRAQLAGDPPPLNHAVRVLRLGVWRLNDAASVERFRRRLKAVAALAQTRGQSEVTRLLLSLAASPQAEGDVTGFMQRAESALAQAAELTG